MADVEGFCDERFVSLRDLFQSNLDSGIDEGGSLAATLNGEFVVDLWGGVRDRKRTKPWERNTLFFVFSTGKPWSTFCSWSTGVCWTSTHR